MARVYGAGIDRHDGKLLTGLPSAPRLRDVLQRSIWPSRGAARRALGGPLKAEPGDGRASGAAQRRRLD
jgi:hypothetical protein